ncbi:MAG: sensor histidine kinase [Thermoactinospora sp.]|nr:sensor histidine kinase [Thermoactinospora sp.]
MENVWLNRVMNAGFYLLLIASASRLLFRHALDGQTVLALVIAAMLGLIYTLGTLYWQRLSHKVRLFWLGSLLVCWLILVEVAPSFSWCAVPLLFMCMRLLSVRMLIVATTVLTAVVVAVQIYLGDRFDPSQILAPIGVAAMTIAVFLEIRRAGVLLERERLSREIHDTIAQGLTSQRMLLQAADRVWDSDPGKARDYVRQAERASGEYLEEARRFVRDLAPAALGGQSLAEALSELNPGDFRLEGTPYPVDPAAEAALLRIAQGALANAREHANATRVVVTLSYLPDAVSLDVVDDGAGFDLDAPSAPGRGYGLKAMRNRVAELGGTLVVESVPGEGTAVAARIPA